MIASRVRPLLLPLVLVAALGACASNAVQPGIVSSSAPAPGNPSSVPPPGAPTQVAYSTPVGGNGRVVSIREIGLVGGGGSTSNGNGTLMGGLIGGSIGATIGAITSQTVGGGAVGFLLGAVGGAIAGTIGGGGSPSSGGPGIEVTVQRDDGQSVTVAQRDDGDVQLGDRVKIVQDGRGVARVVRDTSRNPD